MRMLIASVAAFLFAVCAMAANTSSKTVGETYPYMCSGAVRDAVLVELKDGTLAQSETVAIGQKDVDQQISGMSASLKDQACAYPVYALEQCITERLIAIEAKDWAKASGRSATSESAVVQAYLKARLPDFAVTDQEAEGFYKEHSKLFGGYPFRDVKSAVVSTVLDEKKDRATSDFKAAVSKRHRIEVSASWFVSRREKWAGNPVETARVSGKPTFVNFGVIGCCDTMYPVVERLRALQGGNINVVFVHVGEQEVLSDLCGVSAIPVQMLFDKDGKELYRNRGHMSEDQILAKFAENGVGPGKGNNYD
jgi:thioredoxin 1